MNLFRIKQKILCILKSEKKFNNSRHVKENSEIFANIGCFMALLKILMREPPEMIPRF